MVNKVLILLLLCVMTVTAHAEVVNVKYYDEPVNIKASTNALNLIKVPYEIVSVHSSVPDKKFGQNDKEFTVSIGAERALDLVIITSKKTFVVNLIPSMEGAAIIDIKDMNEARGNTSISTGSNPLYESVSDLIKAMHNRQSMRGYYVNNTTDAYKLENVATVTRVSSYEGVRYKGIIYNYYNTTNDVQHLTVDSPDLERLLMKINNRKSFVAVSVSNERIEPKTATDIFFVMEADDAIRE